MNSTDVGVVGVEDGHLGRAPVLPPLLITPAKASSVAHKAERAAGRAAAGHRLAAGAQRAEVVPVPDPYLKSMASVRARSMSLPSNPRRS